MSKENLLKEFRKQFGIFNFTTIDDEFGHRSDYSEDDIESFLSQAIDQTREETIKSEIKYWEGVFDKRPKNRDLESDNIAQNFARIEIERLQSLINLRK
jgi:hypothetical protein